MKNLTLATAKRARKRKRDQGKRKRERQARQGQEAPKTQRLRARAAMVQKNIAKGQAPFSPQVLVDLDRERLKLAGLRYPRNDPWEKKAAKSTD